MFKPVTAHSARLVARAGVLPAALCVAALAGTTLAQAPSSQPPSRVSMPTAPGKNAKLDSTKVKVSEHNTVDIHVQGEEISNVLEMLAIQSQKNIVASKSVGGKIPSLNLYGVTFYEALDAILHVNGYGYVEQGNFIYVYTIEELKQIEAQLRKRTAKTFTLSYLSAADAAEFVKPMLSQGAEVKTLAKAGKFESDDKLPVGGEGAAMGATMVVFDYEENVDAIGKLLTELDTRPAQVLVEATVLATNVSEANAWGVDFSLIGSANFTDFVGGPLTTVSKLITGANGPNAQAFNSTVGNTNLGKAGVKFGVIADPLAVFVRALDEVGDTTTLANPKILALNRQSSVIAVGQRIPYVSTTQTDTSNTQTVQFLETGVQLYFRPFVLSNGQIRMEIRPQLSDAEIKTVRGPSGPIDAPQENKQTVSTNIIVPDGMTVVIGGLFKEATTSKRNQFPLLGDIPVVGAAFKGHDDQLDRQEIIFCVTPTVINDGSMLSQGEDAKNTTQRVIAGTRQGMLPWSRDRQTAQLNVEAAEAARGGDYAHASALVSRSLGLNSHQPDALALRERINNEREQWPTREMFGNVINNVVEDRRKALPVANPGAEWNRPAWTSYDLPKVHGTGKAREDKGNKPAPAPEGEKKASNADFTDPMNASTSSADNSGFNTAIPETTPASTSSNNASAEQTATETTTNTNTTSTNNNDNNFNNSTKNNTGTEQNAAPDQTEQPVMPASEPQTGALTEPTQQQYQQQATNRSVHTGTEQTNGWRVSQNYASQQPINDAQWAPTPAQTAEQIALEQQNQQPLAQPAPGVATVPGE